MGCRSCIVISKLPCRCCAISRGGSAAARGKMCHTPVACLSSRSLAYLGRVDLDAYTGVLIDTFITYKDSLLSG